MGDNCARVLRSYTCVATTGASIITDAKSQRELHRGDCAPCASASTDRRIAFQGPNYSATWFPGCPLGRLTSPTVETDLTPWCSEDGLSRYRLSSLIGPMQPSRCLGLAPSLACAIGQGKCCTPITGVLPRWKENIGPRIVSQTKVHQHENVVPYCFESSMNRLYGSDGISKGVLPKYFGPGGRFTLRVCRRSVRERPAIRAAVKTRMASMKGRRWRVCHKFVVVLLHEVTRTKEGARVVGDVAVTTGAEPRSIAISVRRRVVRLVGSGILETTKWPWGRLGISDPDHPDLATPIY